MIMRRFILMVVASLMVSMVAAQVTVDRPYAVGADISWLQSQEDRGIKFSDGGVEGDALDILFLIEPLLDGRAIKIQSVTLADKRNVVTPHRSVHRRFGFAK